MTLPFGIDISKYQDPAMINYDKIAEQVDFVILRIGFGWTASGTKTVTTSFFYEVA